MSNRLHSVNDNEIELQENSFNNEANKSPDPQYSKIKQQTKDINLEHLDDKDKNIKDYNSYDFNVKQNIENDEVFRTEKFKVPSHLKKTFICTVVLAGLGIILIILGSIRQIAAADPGKGITFWVLGSIVTIPGGYYSYQFYRAKRAQDMQERDEILDDIPEL